MQVRGYFSVVGFGGVPNTCQIAPIRRVYRHTDPVREQDAERIALDIYQQADKTGERITLGTVERRLAELAGHPPGHCQLCTAAANVTVHQVYWVAACWQAQIAVTRRRATC
jgi:hypothetical protein